MSTLDTNEISSAIQTWRFDKHSRNTLLGDEKLVSLYVNEYMLYGELDSRVWPEGEPLILKDAEAASVYCCHIKGNWKEAEAIISTDAKAACRYAELVLKQRWPEVEEMIARDP